VTVRAALAVSASTLAALAATALGFAGAHTIAAEPPLVVNCTNVQGWAVEVMKINCLQAGKIIHKLTRTKAPATPVRSAGLTCTVAPAGRTPTAISCAGGARRWLRAGMRIQQTAVRLVLPAVKRCGDYVDDRGRRWEIRIASMSCDLARELVSELATLPRDSDNIRSTEKLYNVSCSAFGTGRLPVQLSCSGSRPAGRFLVISSFYASVRLAPTPSTTTATTTIRRP
jgi:hypothetical protein